MAKTFYQVTLKDGVKKALLQRDLVNGVVLDYIKNHPSSNLADLQQAFPLRVQKKLEIVVDEAEANRQNVDGKGQPRKYYHIFDQVKLPDGAALAICNQWGAANIDGFLDHARQLGYQISLDGEDIYEAKHGSSSVVAGSIYHFANYDWLVLTVENGKALLISEKILDKRPYEEFAASPPFPTWEQCTLRKHLNLEFYNSLGDAKSKISDTHNMNPDNPIHKRIGGNPTVDKIFLLSFEEVCRYFGDSTQALHSHLAQEYPSGWISDSSDAKRAAKHKKSVGAWTLRSPGRNIDSVACVDFNGQVNLNGYYVSAPEGIRPALWINLS